MLSKTSMRAAMAAALMLPPILAPSLAQACACGCGAFSVGAGDIMPDGSRAMIFGEYDFMDQSQNWRQGSKASADDNDDKKIRTEFHTVGGQYQINMNWSVAVEVPLWNRAFTTTTDDGVKTFTHAALGDVRITTTYTGLSRDMSLGLTAGLKLPTGDHSYANFDPDTEISSGSTDLLLGGYKQGLLNRDGTLTYFAHALWDKPIDWRANYRPGEELNVAAGLAGSGWSLAADKVQLRPVLQLIGSVRARDHGPDGHPSDSGYERILLSPGLEAQMGRWRVFADVAVPVYQRMNGNQLIAPVLFKAQLIRAF